MLHININREMQIKTTMKYHYTPTRKGKIQNTDTTNADEDVEWQNCHILLVGMQNGTTTLEDSLEITYKTKHTLTM